MDEKKTAASKGNKKSGWKKIVILLLVLIFLIFTIFFSNFSGKHLRQIWGDISNFFSFNACDCIDICICDEAAVDSAKVYDWSDISGFFSFYGCDCINVCICDDAAVDSAKVYDSLKILDSLRIADSLRVADSLSKARRRAQRVADSVALVKPPTVDAPVPDSLLKDTVAVQEQLAIVTDTIAPYVYANPPGGVHYRKIAVRLLSDDPKAKIYFKKNVDDSFSLYVEPIERDSDFSITFFGVDTVGNVSDTLVHEYVFEAPKCPQGMVYVDKGSFCIDEHLWPNRKGEMPLNFVSYYTALDSCVSVGKRLCTANEWVAACSRPGSRFVYVGDYDRRKCNTESQRPSPLGAFPECRSYRGAYDMIGNLAEWTSTPAEANRSFFKVYGGNYSTSSLADCNYYKFSYFPQNRYMSIGFRCCKESK